VKIRRVERLAEALAPAVEEPARIVPPPTGPPRLWRLIRTGLGVVLLLGLIYQLGDAAMWRQIISVGWWLPVAMLPYGVFCTLDVIAWRCLIPGGIRPSVGRLYRIRMAGESVNDYTPTATLGGEPYKAYMLHDSGVRMTTAVASIVLARTAVTVGQVLFIVSGFAVLVVHAHLEILWLLVLAILMATAVLFIGALVRWQRRGLLSAVVRFMRRFVGPRFVGPIWAARSEAVDREVAEVYDRRRRTFALSVFLHFVSWATGAVELIVFVWLVGGRASWIDLITIEALNLPLKAAAILIPGTLGVQEAGGVAAFALLGLDPRLGLAVMLLRRAREVLYGVVGLVMMRSLPQRAVKTTAAHA